MISGTYILSGILLLLTPAEVKCLNKTQSLRALDLLNFCNAGIQTGLRPFISIFYTAVRTGTRDRLEFLLGASRSPESRYKASSEIGSINLIRNG